MQRKISFWIKGTYDTNEFVVTTDLVTQRHLINDSQHYNFVVAFNDPKNLKIQCLRGHVDLGQVDINYSWIINPYYHKNFPQDVDALLSSNFDLSHGQAQCSCSPEFIDSLQNHNFWIDSGADRYSATQELVLGPKINSIPTAKNNGWFEINAGDCLTFDLYVPRPSVDYATRNQVLAHEKNTQQFETVQLYSYDHDQINGITNQFQMYVDRYCADPTSCWTAISQPPSALPYTEKIRIQSQLINNLDLIKDRKLVDFGCDRGQYLYPSLMLGAGHVTGAQIVAKHNDGINAALEHMGLDHRACAVDCDIYDLDRVKQILDTGIETILCLGLIYHVNHHYQLLKTFSASSATAIVIDSMIHDLDFYLDPVPLIRWKEEHQHEHGNGIEIASSKPGLTWTGTPNAAWIWHALINLGWHPRSSTVTNSLALNYPQFRTRGVITATRQSG